LEPARVKWFDKGKGFGFANVFAGSEDVFVHIEVLRLSGFADLAAGEAVCLRIIEGKRGRMAAQVAVLGSGGCGGVKADRGRAGAGCLGRAVRLGAMCRPAWWSSGAAFRGGAIQRRDCRHAGRTRVARVDGARADGGLCRDAVCL
jgi:cold shock CspA family protein